MPEIPGELLWEESIDPGGTWSHVLKRGTTIRLTTTAGGANVGALFYNADNPVERYNMPDTLKAQHIARLTESFVLYSDMGRILCSVTRDTAGWHDALSGCSNAAIVRAKYGEANYQEHRNNSYKNALDSFLVELAKYGMDARDLTANVNFFSKVVVDASGAMHFEANGKPGSYVDIRAEMNVLAIFNTCQHPLDPNPGYEPKPVQLAVYRGQAAAPDDPCRLSRPENGRGFILTERYFA